MSRERHYKAFISYNHSDEAWARWLQRALENYRLPKTLRQSRPTLPQRLFPIFRDRDELASTDDLSESIRKAMDDSDALIVICSPAARKSSWVNEEIRRFRASDRGHRIFCLMIAGSPDPKSPDCAFPDALLQDAQGHIVHEPLAADATPNGDGKRNAMLKIAAGLLGVGVDDLKRRDAQRQARFWSIVAGGAAFIAMLTIGLAIYALDAKRESEIRRSQAENLISFMLGDLRKNLEPIGKLELLDSIGDQAMAYFAAIGANGTEKEMLERAKAMKQIGDVRFNQGDLKSALKIFQQALAQTRALHESSPANNDYLFELGQAEFWVGYVAWKRGELDQASASMHRYMEISRQLSNREPNNTSYQMELSYAYGNLGSVALAQGRHEEALRQFKASLSLLAEKLAKAPDNTLLAMDTLDSVSWIGSTLQELGRLHESRNTFAQAADLIKPFHLQGKDARASSQYATIISYQSEISARLGDIPDAKRLLDEAAGIYAALIARDPSNAPWKQHWATIKTKQFSLILPSAWTPEIRAEHAHAEAGLLALIKADPSNLPFQTNLVDIRRLGILDLLAHGHAASALDTAEQTWSDWQAARKGRPQAREMLYSEARLQEALGSALATNGQQAEAERQWRECAQKLEASKNPDPALLALRYLLALDLGQTEMAKQLETRLAQSEFRDPRMTSAYTLSGTFR